MKIKFFADVVPKMAKNFRQFCTGEFGQGIILGLYTHWHAEKRHKVIKGPMCKGNNEKAKYVLLP
uniref:PPIase cyclophilin-type domain-containing protein n=1 Tax=Neovison vison TaxID=452646 RepID=A0A8C7BTR5_NEOVI